jgi:hypothetical protein
MHAQAEPPTFASAIGKVLTAAQLDAYIDLSITGSDRILARKLMSFMPPGMRGDFVFIRTDGTMISNRPSVLAGATLNLDDTARAKRPAHAVRRAASVVEPPIASDSGPYARQYSGLGIDAAFGYATIDCNDQFLSEYNGSQDNGDMYFGGFGNGGLEVGPVPWTLSALRRRGPSWPSHPRSTRLNSGKRLWS